jgi:hypothetical protein
MISKCANPSCSVPFLYLHEGRIFAAHSTAAARSAAVERYWLCDACAQTMTLVLHANAVQIRKLPEPGRAAAAGNAAGRMRRPAA